MTTNKTEATQQSIHQGPKISSHQQQEIHNIHSYHLKAVNSMMSRKKYNNKSNIANRVPKTRQLIQLEAKSQYEKNHCTRLAPETNTPSIERGLIVTRRGKA